MFVVAHDWGALIAWHLCLFRPDKVKALVNSSVHFFPRNPNMNTVEGLKAVYGEDHYISRFQVLSVFISVSVSFVFDIGIFTMIFTLQVPGDIEAEFAPIGAKSVLKKILTFRDTAPFYFPKGKGLEALPDAPVALSSWLSEEELDYYANKFEKTGFTGGVNYYRALPM